MENITLLSLPPRQGVLSISMNNRIGIRDTNRMQSIIDKNCKTMVVVLELLELYDR